MDGIIELIVLFIIGFIMDMLITLSIIKVQEKKAVIAGIYSVLIILMSCLVLDNILGKANNLINIISYALGNGVGCWYTVYKSIKKNDKIS